MAIYIEKGTADELYVSFTFDHERVRRIKEIKGCRWNPSLKHWILPNSLDIINKLVVTFYDEELILDPSIDLEEYED